jgi:hypothetical protein
MVEYREDNSQLDPFEKRVTLFSENKLGRITCDTLEQRDTVLSSVKARIGPLESVGEYDGKIVFCRCTDNENILVEDILDPDDRKYVTWLIYRTDFEYDN